MWNAQKETTENVSEIGVFEGMYQLSERYWRIYKLLDLALKKVEIIVKGTLDQNSYELMENVASTIAYLGLSESFQVLKEINRINLSDDVRKLIDETINELDGNFDTPYSGLE